jgi:hypothetical protein
VERIRVAISDLPGVLRDVISMTVTRAPDMALVDGVPDDGFDVLIELHDQREALESVPALLVRRASSSVVGVAERGHDSVLWELRPERVSLNELSPDELLDAIRASVRARAASHMTIDPRTPSEED